MTAHLAQHSTIIRDPTEALEQAIGMAHGGGAVFATGSLYLVGDLRTYWRTRKSAAAGPHS
jgi:folylpolyglutamate synthase/dihydropteroate synthase